MSEERMYLAVDPGVVSGVAVWYNEQPLDTMKRWEIHGIAETAAFVRQHLGHGQGFNGWEQVVVTEKFIINQRTIKTKVFYESLYFNGWLLIQYPHSVEQTASQAKGFATDRMLRHLDWYTKTKDGHANDAARHLLYRAVKNNEPRIIEAMKEYAA